MLKIDSHHHLWDLTLTPQPWIQGKNMSVINKSFSIQDLETTIANTGISKTVLVQTVPNYLETPLLLKLASQASPICGVVGWMKVDEEDALSHLDEFLSNEHSRHLVGIRDMAQDLPDANYLVKPTSIKNIRALGEKNLTFDILIKPPQLSAARELIRSAPNTRFIIDHGAKPLIKSKTIEPWKEFMGEIGEYDNVVCKISGLITEADWEKWVAKDIEPYFEVLLKSFGPEKLMFGSDWPVSLLAGTYIDVVRLAEELTSLMSSDELEMFWAKNACYWYKLKI